MNKKTKYWAIGILAAILMILILAVTVNADRSEQQPESSAAGQSGVSQNGGHAHSAMEHGMSGGQTGNEALDSYHQEQNEIMADMMKGMMDIPKTGSAAIDFLNGMIPHHESAVAMAESLLKHGGENEELKDLANDIIRVQNQEMDQMNAMIQTLESGGQKEEDQEAAYLEAYGRMFDDPSSHHADTSGATSVDQAFAEGMIAHHQMAVDMARLILEYTDDTQVIELAQTIIDAQEQEIRQMQDILDTLK